MKRLIVISAVLILFTTFLDAQQGMDTLYLKNGSVVTGNLRKFMGKEVQIMTSEGLLFTFSSQDIDRYVRSEEPVDEKTSQAVVHDFNGWGFGISNSIIVNCGMSACLYLSEAYTFKSRHTVSFSTGLELSDKYHLPLIIDYRYDLLRRNVTPFVYARGGGSIDLQYKSIYNQSKGGLTFGVGTGLRWPMGKIESYVTFGFRHVIEFINPTFITSYPEDGIAFNVNRFETGWGFKF